MEHSIKSILKKIYINNKDLEMKVINIIVALTFMLLITGCNSSSDEPITEIIQEEVNPAGIWIGYQTILTENGRGVFDMKTLIYDGKFYGVSEDANILYSGSYEMTHGKYLVTNGIEDSNTSYRIYDVLDNGKFFANGMTALNVKEQESFSGAFENDVLQEGEVSATFTQLYNKASSLEYIKGDINTSKVNLNINESGTISGTFKECQIDGTISVPDSSVNMYKLGFTLVSCEDSGTYNGLGVVALDSNNSAYFMALASDEDGLKMEVFFDYLEETPSEFLESLEIDSDTSKNAKARASNNVSSECGGLNNIDGLDYSYMILQRCDYTDISAIKTNFSNANLREADFTDAYAYQSDFKYTDLSSASFYNADIYNSWFHYADLSSANFIGALLKYTQFTHSDLRRTDFSNTSLTSTGFQYADARGANFFAANTEYAVFWGADLSFSNFQGAKNTQDAHFDDIYDYDRRPNLSNAWWIDGRRCNANSISGYCKFRDADNGLTYEEYLNAKRDTDIDREKAEQESYDMSNSFIFVSIDRNSDPSPFDIFIAGKS